MPLLRFNSVLIGFETAAVCHWETLARPGVWDIVRVWIVVVAAIESMFETEARWLGVMGANPRHGPTVEVAGKANH